MLITEKEFIELLTFNRCGRALREYAGELGVSFQHLDMVLRGKRGPGPRLARALGFEQVTAFRKPVVSCQLSVVSKKSKSRRGE